MSTVLNRVKKMLGLADDYDVYDVEILSLINQAGFTIEHISGVPNVFPINESTTVDELSTISPHVDYLVTYLYIKVRLVFDPPSTGYLVDVLKEHLREIEWRLEVHTNPAPFLP